MSGTKRIKTKRETIYRLLVESVDDPPDRSPDHEVYPFEYAYELFTAGLVVGYIENEQFDGEYDGDGEYHPWVRFTQFAENNPDHLACVELFEKLISLEHEGEQAGQEEVDPEADSDDEEDESDDSEPSKVIWDDIVDYADKGVGVLFAEWNETGKFDLEQYFSSVEHDVDERFDTFQELLTERPTTGNQGDISF